MTDIVSARKRGNMSKEEYGLHYAFIKEPIEKRGYYEGLQVRTQRNVQKKFNRICDRYIYGKMNEQNKRQLLFEIDKFLKWLYHNLIIGLPVEVSLECTDYEIKVVYKDFAGNPYDWEHYFNIPY